MTEFIHILPWAVLAGAVVAVVEALLLRAVRGRSLGVVLAVMVAFPLVAVLLFVVAISGFMFTQQLMWTLIACVLIGVAVGPAAVVLARDTARRELAMQSDRAAEHAAETSRRELIAWISHDLRTPLAGIRAMGEALEDSVVDHPEDMARYARRIGEETQRLAAMVDDLFELSRINSGTLQIVFGEVAVDEVVCAAVESARPTAHARGIEVAINPASDDTTARIRGSAHELTRVLGNLLTNAIRHTPTDGRIVVDVRPGSHDVVVAVQDACGGIPDEELPFVFDTAFRGERARSPVGGSGAGLGLAIARGLVEAHGGHISVANRHPGCRFEVRLPVGVVRVHPTATR
ncbi:sensor histidine kinase KdpD [Williamsia sp. CHRR-6]|uniref:sensor histidine kinase n=1 Tax=Williamsia sp. CHRR-6 TaxID=2835871 RepID=UPI001BDA8D82|nr:ATP-binding protein [Williamsia sp. CHRR-6]MBT0566364.1 sensor histidine kinase [Williamsia sp. CHRR-6]